MSIEITLTLPEGLVEYAKRFGGATQRGVETVLADALQMILPMLDALPNGANDTLYPSISSLSDAEVMALADSKMDIIQNERLGELQTQGKIRSLTEAERYELIALLQIYQIGQLRKAEGLAEAVQRRLRSPLPA
jgi:hypothetical protein